MDFVSMLRIPRANNSPRQVHSLCLKMWGHV